MDKFELRNEHIELNKLLKVLGWTQSGGHAKQIIQNNEVLRNGTVESRVRAKLIAGDEIEWNELKIKIGNPPELSDGQSLTCNDR